MDGDEMVGSEMPPNPYFSYRLNLAIKSNQPNLKPKPYAVSFRVVQECEYSLQELALSNRVRLE
jgi:hypothetical protein